MDNKDLNQEISESAPDPVDRLLQEKKPASSGKAIAILALLIALAAVAATGWQWWQTYQGDPEAAKQSASLARLQTTQQQLGQTVAAVEAQLQSDQASGSAVELSQLARQLQQSQGTLDQLQGQAGEDQATINALQGSVRSLEQRLSTNESGLLNVAASTQNSSVELDIAEVDYLLRVANERLQLFSDPTAADLALQAADMQIEAMDDPMFLSVRQRIASARQALASVPRVDRVQLSASITDMQSQLAGLSFRGEEAAQEVPLLADDAGWWENFKYTLSSLVTVKRRAPEDEAMLSLDDKDYLRQGLWLQLESARLALMRNDSSAYTGSLERVRGTVEQFFHTGSSAVQAMLLETTKLQQAEIAPAMPDISAPWTQFRQLRDSRRLLQSAQPVANEGTVESEGTVE